MDIRELIKKANEGDAKSQYELAMRYIDGDGVKQSYYNAALYARMSADQNYPEGMNLFGYLLFNGTGVSQNQAEAVMWYSKAAELGHAMAQNNLGECYFLGKGVEQCYEKGAEWYSKAAELGHKAVMWYRKAAEQGNPKAQNNLAFCYFNGYGVEQNYEKAAEWWSEAAKKGNPKAQNNLAFCYFNGYGVEQNYEKAAEWWSEAAKKGNPKAQNNLAFCYENGKGVEQSYEKAAEWYRKAAEQGDVEAQIALQLLEGESAEKFEKDYEIFNAGKRYDLFISWNHEDKEFKDELVKGIENFNFSEVKDKEQKIYTHYRAWESDRDASGRIEQCIENAISNSKFFLVILSENSIKSKWVEKEVQMALDMVKSKKWSEKNLLVVYLNTKKYDVSKSISALEEGNVFKELDSHSANFAMDKCDEKTVSDICGKIKTGLQRAAIANYRYNMTDGNSSFKYSLRNQYVNSELFSMGSIVEALLSFEEGYIERSVYKVTDNIETSIETSLSDLAKSNASFFLVGEGGTGKSLYLSNMMRKYFGDTNFFLRVNLIDYEKEIAAIDYLTDLLAKELNRYLVDSDEYRSRNIVDRAREDFGHLTIMFDGLDETGRETKEKLISLIEGYKCSNCSDRFIFTSRTVDCFDSLQAVFGGSLELYRLEGFDKNQCRKLYQNIEKKMVKDKKDSDKTKFVGKGDDIDMSMFRRDGKALEEEFFVNLSSLGDEIKKNPMLLSNLIFIYLKNQGRDFPTHKYEVIDKSIGIFLNDLEEDRGIKMRFKYYQYLTPDKIKDMLGTIAFRKLQGNTKDFGELLKEYFKEDRCQSGDNYEDVAIAVYDYLSRRAIISTDKITHDIFTAFFACCYIFDKIYKLYRNDFDIESWQFREGGSYSGKDYLEKHLEDGVLKRGDGMWPEICAELLMKLDYEINAVSRKSMDTKNPNYAVFDETLTKTLKDKGFSDAAIETVRELAKINNGFYYVEFLRKYLPA